MESAGRQRRGAVPGGLTRRLAVALALTLAGGASAQTYKVLKSFTGSDGNSPQAGLVLAGSALYGTAWGSYLNAGVWYVNNGVVFKVNTDGSGYTMLKSFTGSDGSLPQGDLVLAGDTLYGTAYAGGASGWGVVFRMSIDGSGYTVLNNFTNGTEGSGPNGGMVLAGSTLYGTTYWTTYYGVPSGEGVVFKLNTDGSGFAVLKSFTGSDGANPYRWPGSGGQYALWDDESRRQLG